MIPAAKKVRRSLSLQTKLNILDSIAAGETITQVARRFGIARSTIITIKHNEASIRDAIIRTADLSGSFTSYVRDPLIEMMEKDLLLWIEANNQINVSLTGEMIREKAREIHLLLQANKTLKAQQKREFRGSSGWFEKFVKRHSLQNVGVKGESAYVSEGAPGGFATVMLKQPSSEEGDPAEFIVEPDVVSTTTTVESNEVLIKQPPEEEADIMECLVEPDSISTAIVKNEQEFNQIKLGELLQMSEQMINLALDEDLNIERAVHFRKDLKRLMARYSDLYKQQSAVSSRDHSSVDGKGIIKKSVT